MKKAIKKKWIVQGKKTGIAEVLVVAKTSDEAYEAAMAWWESGGDPDGYDGDWEDYEWEVMDAGEDYSDWIPVNEP